MSIESFAYNPAGLPGNSRRLVLDSGFVPHAIGYRYWDGYGDAMVSDSLSGRIDGDEGCIG